MSDSLREVITEMCRRVGADPTSFDFKNNSWYMQYNWTEQECEQFRKWLSDYLYNNAKARRELMNWPIKRRKETDRLANEFVFMYGWKYYKE